MVGIYRKIKQILGLVKKYAPVLDKIVPGMGSIIGTGAGAAEIITDGVNSVYNDYQSAKKQGKKYGILDGIHSFASPQSGQSVLSQAIDFAPTAMKTLTKAYGELHPRLKLKGDGT